MGLFFEQYHAKFRLISLPALGRYARGIRNCYHHIAAERAKHAVVTDGFSLRQYLFCHPLAEQRTFPCTVCNGLAHPFPNQTGQKQGLLHCSNSSCFIRSVVKLFHAESRNNPLYCPTTASL